MLLKIVQPLLNNVGAIDADSAVVAPYSIVGVFVLRGLGSYVSEYGLAWIGSRVVYDLRCEACDRLAAAADGVLRRDVGGLPPVPDHVRRAADRGRPPRKRSPCSIRNTLTIAFMLGYLLYLNWQLTLIALATVPLLAISLRKMRRRMKRVSTMVQDRTGSLTHALEEAIGAHRIVKIFGGEKYEGGRLRAAADKLRLVDGEAGGGVGARHADQPDHRLDRRRRHSVGRGTAHGAAADTTRSAISSLTSRRSFTLRTSCKTLSNVQAVTQRGLTAAESVFALIDEPPEPDAGTIELGRARGSIRFENVTKRYAENAPLRSPTSTSRSPRANPSPSSDPREAARRRSST